MAREQRPVIIFLLIISLIISALLILHNKASPKIDINSASVEALESLPDVGNVLAHRIIQGRPYKDVYELDRVKGIGPQTIEAIKDRVVVK